MGEQLSYSILSLDRAGYTVGELDLNRPAESEQPDAVSLTVFEAASCIDVVVSRGMCPTGGYDIDVQDVRMCGEREISITVALVDPGPGDVVTMMMTRPVKVVRFPRDAFPARRVSVRDPDGCVMDAVDVNF